MQLSKRTKNIGVLLLVFFGILVVAYRASTVLNPFLLAFLFSYVLHPLVAWLERKRVHRTFTIIVLYVFGLGAFAGVLFVALPLATEEVVGFWQSAFVGDETVDVRGVKHVHPAYVTRIEGWVQRQIDRWNRAHPGRTLYVENVYDQIKKDLAQNVTSTAETGARITEWVWQTTGQALSAGWTLLQYLVLVPIYMFFLLRGMNSIRDGVYAHLPGRQRERVVHVLARIHAAMSSFFRGKMLICLAKGLLTAAGLALLGVRLPLLFGAIQAVASLVPFVVLIVGWVPSVIVVLLDAGPAWGTLFGVTAVYLVLEGVESFVLTPLILGKETGLHPMVLLLSLLVGGELFGLFGLILAVPVVSILKILGQEYLLPPLRELASETLPEGKAP